MEDVPPKVIKRADSLVASSASGWIVSVIGVVIPFLAFLGVAIGFGYMAETRGLLAKHPGLDPHRRIGLERAVGRFKIMGIIGALVGGGWALLIGLVLLIAK